MRDEHRPGTPPRRPRQWRQAVDVARETCARFFRDGRSPADTMCAYGFAPSGSGGLGTGGRPDRRAALRAPGGQARRVAGEGREKAVTTLSPSEREAIEAYKFDVLPWRPKACGFYQMPKRWHTPPGWPARSSSSRRDHRDAGRAVQGWFAAMEEAGVRY